MADPFYTCCEDGMLSQVPPTDSSGLCPACKAIRRKRRQTVMTRASAMSEKKGQQ